MVYIASLVQVSYINYCNGADSINLCLRRHIMKLTKLMQEYNASDLDELMDILPNLDFDEE